MRILYVSNDANYFLMHRVEVARAARAQGWEVHLAAPQGEAVAGVETEGFVFHPIRLERSFAPPWVELGTLLALWRLMRRLRPDVAHLFTIKPVILGGIAARLAGVRAVVSAVTGLGYVFLRSTLPARVLRLAVYGGYRAAFGHPRTRVVFENPEDRDLLVRRHVVRATDCVLSRGTGIDLVRYAPQPEPDGEPVVVLPARMLWDKGVGTFVAAVQHLRGAGVQARFALVGEPDPGNPGTIPARQLSDWEAAGLVELWGWRPDMPGVYAACHIVCLPTRFREGLSRVLLEAAACGRPIVATDRPGCRRIVTDGDNGLLVPVDDSHALAAALRRLIEQPEQRRRMGQRGRAIVEADFTVEQVVADTLAVYRELTTAG